MRKILIIFILIVITCNISFAENDDILSDQSKSLNISGFLEKSKEYTKDLDEEIDINGIYKNALTGNLKDIGIIESITNKFGKELKSTINSVVIVVIIIIIHSILVQISESLGNKDISNVAYFVEYILIITVVLENFSSTIIIVKETITNMVGFINSLIPLLLTLMLTTGAFVSVGIIKPILLILINFISNFILDFILPLTIIGTILGIIAGLTDKIKISKIAKFLKSTGVWILGVAMTLFVTVLSLEGSITETVDGVTAKTTKAAVSTVIPVVGKILGDAADSVIGCAGILKNAVGFIGIIVITTICIGPIIKLTLLTLTYNLAACVCEPIADEKVIKLLDSVSDTFKTLLAIIFCISVLLIIGLTLVIKVSNGTLLYR